MNYPKNGRLKIQKLPYSDIPYESLVFVFFVGPSKKKYVNIEIKVEQWTINWN